ncbi:hypothetical protein BV20DRAFT_970985 [Pilatotrama ljubarskyi]|nr:hypothetical protein BV20DRAFT_970985 [Pilatotrama ljubarskyi]
MPRRRIVSLSFLMVGGATEAHNRGQLHKKLEFLERVGSPQISRARASSIYGAGVAGSKAYLLGQQPFLRAFRYDRGPQGRSGGDGLAVCAAVILLTEETRQDH